MENSCNGSRNMEHKCQTIHELFNGLKVFRFPFNDNDIPLNGIYILFESGETAHGANRIVRIGTHNSENNLPSRLKEHFLNENKDRSIFRKNIGRCILNKQNDDFLDKWELDLTTKANRERHGNSIDFQKQSAIEKLVSEYIRDKIYFVIFRVDNKDERLRLESKIISTVSWCGGCQPSINWLGRFSPKEKIRTSGLWQEQGLFKESLSDEDMNTLKKIR